MPNEQADLEIERLSASEALSPNQSQKTGGTKMAKKTKAVKMRTNRPARNRPKALAIIHVAIGADVKRRLLTVSRSRKTTMRDLVEQALDAFLKGK